MAQSTDPSYYANLPAGIPPPGVTANLDHPESRAIEAHIGMGVCIGVTLVFLLLRIYVKLAVAHMWGWDDVACLLGFALMVGHDAVSFTIMGPGGGLGTHIWDIRLSRFTKSYLQSTLASINLYAASAFFVKLSLFLLYLRLFKPNRVTRWLVYGGIVVCGLFYSASIISNCVLCMPKPGQLNDATAWKLRAQECGAPSTRLAVVQGVFGTLSDVYLLVIPIQSIFKLHLPTERKIGVSAIFMIGIIAIACSLGSLSYRAKLLSVKDVTWFGVSIYIFSGAEVSAGIICSCMPILASLFRGHAPPKFQFPSLRFFSSFFTTGNSSKQLVSGGIRSSDNVHAGKRGSSSGQATGEYMELERGTGFAKSNNAPDWERVYVVGKS